MTVAVFFMLASLSIIHFSDMTFANDIPKFGCEFDNDYNLLNLPRPEDEDGNPIIQIDPVWSEEDLKTATFKDEKEFKVFLNTLDKAQDAVIKKHNYNSLNNLLEFWDEYNKHRDMSLTEFFPKYEEQVKPQDGAFFTIELAKRMIEDPQFADKIGVTYLSTCSLINYNSEFQKLFTENKLSDIDELPMDLFHDHVMGFMKIEIGEDSGRTGVVVMDPGMGLQDIIVLMDDKNDTLHRAVTDGVGRIVTGAAHGYERVGDYISVFIQTGGDPKEKPRRQLCYIKKGYCSFEETTRKPALNNAVHGIMSRDEDGELVAGIVINLFNNVDSKVGITVYLREFNYKHIRTGSLAKLKEHFKTNPADALMIRHVAQDLKIDPTDLQDSIDKVVQTMTEDTEIRSQMIELYKYFKNKPHAATNS